MSESIIEQGLDQLDAEISNFRAQCQDENEIDWDKRWRRRVDRELYLAPDGQHLLITGTIGTGKTQLLLYFVRQYVKKTKSVIVWNDCGKTSEFVNLGRLRPLKVFVPEGCDIKITVKPEYEAEWHYTEDGKVAEIFYFKPTQISNMWRAIDPEKINVLCFLPYIVDDMTLYANMIGNVFKKLVRLAQREELPPHVEIFIDEFQLVCPEKVNQLSDQHFMNGAIVQSNAERLRSCGVGLKAASQGIVKIRSGIRPYFTWRAIKAGSRFLDEEDLPLKEKNFLWIKLKKNEFYLAAPDRSYTNKPVTFDYFGEGKSVARVQYIGVMHGKDKEEEVDV